MADTPKMYRVYSIVPRNKQDDYWLNIGVAFPHDDGQGFNFMLRSLPLTSSSSSGGRQRTRFHASISSITTSGSTPCHKRCPANEAIVELRCHSFTPACTSSRQ